MSDRVFVDTNVIVYGHDRASGKKFERAVSLIESLWETGDGVLSTQVLQETYVNLRRKLAVPMTATEARAVVNDFLSWTVVVTDGASILGAIEREERYPLSFWDALIIQAASEAGATIVYSEDLNAGQSYGNVRVDNPFLVQ